MSVASLFGMAANFIFFGIGSSIVGFIFDKLTVWMNDAGVIGIQMDAMNTISHLHLIYAAGPFLYVLALGYNHIVNSNREYNQVV